MGYCAMILWFGFTIRYLLGFKVLLFPGGGSACFRLCFVLVVCLMFPTEVGFLC